MPAYYPNPPVVTVPASPFILSDFEVPTTWGPQYFNSARYICGFQQAGPDINKVQIIKSTDAGVTWIAQDTGNLPDIDWGFGDIDFAFDTVTGIIHILGFSRANTGNNLAYSSFDMNTDTYGASVDAAIRAGANTGKIAVMADGTPIAFFTQLTGPGNGAVEGNPIQYSTITAGVFSVPVNLVNGIAGRVQNALSTILDSVGTMHLCQQNETATDLSPQQIRHVSLSSGFVASSPTLIYENPGPIIWNRHYPVGIGQEFGGNIFWAVVDPNNAQAVLVFKGSPSAVPVWSVLTGASVSAANKSPTFQAHIVPFGTGFAVFYFDQLASQAVQNAWYLTFDGVSFSLPILAWNVHDNTIAGGPNPPEAIGYFSIAANPNGVELAGNAFIDTDFNQSVVFLSPEAAPPGECSREQQFSLTIYPPQYFFGNAQQLVCDVRYPWLIPPNQRTPWKQEGSIPAPAMGVLTEIWAYLIPDNFYLVLDRIRHFYSPVPIVGGSGAIIWGIDVDTPIGNPLATQRPVSQFTNAIGGPGKKPFPVGPLQFRGGQTVRYKVIITDPTVATGLPNIVSALGEGWLYPVTQSGN